MQSGKADQNDDAQFFSRYFLKVAAVTEHVHSGAFISLFSEASLKAAFEFLQAALQRFVPDKVPV